MILQKQLLICFDPFFNANSTRPSKMKFLHLIFSQILSDSFVHYVISNKSYFGILNISILF